MISDFLNILCQDGVPRQYWTLTCTIDRRPVIITRRLGSWVNARDPAMTLNTAYTNNPNADTRSRMSLRSLCGSARNLRLWTLSNNEHRISALVDWRGILQYVVKKSPFFWLSHFLCNYLLHCMVFYKIYSARICQLQFRPLVSLPCNK